MKLPGKEHAKAVNTNGSFRKVGRSFLAAILSGCPCHLTGQEARPTLKASFSREFRRLKKYMDQEN
jgi:hypothetical protein